MIPRCHGSKPNGTPCKRIVGASQQYCFSHSPERKAERSRNARRAGRSRSGGELGEVRDLLKKVTAMILNGDIETASAAVLNQVLNTRVRLIEVTRRVQEQEELLERLSELEERAVVGGQRA